MDQKIDIRNAVASDAQAIADIYNHYIVNTTISFEIDELSTSEMKQRIETVLSVPLPWLVAESDNSIVGYAYAGPWHSRWAYRQSVEASIYLAPDHTGHGTGTRLYQQLIEALQALEIHTVIGGVALPNDGSVALHEKLGFVKAAHYKEVGCKFDQWIDVGYWQRML